MDNDALKTIGFVGMILIGVASVFLPLVVVALLALAATYKGLPFADLSGLWAGLAGLSALLGGWFIVQGAQGLRRRPSSPVHIARPWLWVGLLALAIALVAGFSNSTAIGGIAQVLGVLLPGIALLAFVSQRLAGADRPATWRQTAAQVSATLTVSLWWSMFWELLAVVGLVMLVGIVIGLSADGMRALEEMREQFSDPAFIASGEILRRPGVIAVLLVLMAGAVPVIEEVGKVLAVGALALARRPSRAQALMWGITCGVTFSIYEAAFANPFPMGSAALVILRAGAMLIHAGTATLTAWGLWEWLAQRRPGRFALGLALAMGLHSAWNVLAVAAGVFQTIAEPAPILGALAAGFVLLSAGAAIVLRLALEPSRLVRVLHIERGEDR